MQTKNKCYKFLKIESHDITPIQVFKNLSGSRRFLLESSFQHSQKGKYSFLGMNPYEEIIGNENETIVINYENKTSEILKQHALQYINTHLPKLQVDDLPLPFCGGAIGYIGYDSIRQFETIGESLTDDIHMPDIHFMLFKNVIVFDHTNKQIYLIAMNPDDRPETVLDEQIRILKQALIAKMNHIKVEFDDIQFEQEMSPEEFKEKVMLAKEHIKQGDIFQVVLSQRMCATIDNHPDFSLSFYEKLRKANPSPYMFYIDFNEYLILGASPESLIQTTGKDIITNPIAGTRIRGKTNAEDEHLMKDLLADKKEIAEHRMLVDLSRNDLGRVCEIGSITVPTYMKIEKYQHVMHIVSKVKGRLKETSTGIDALIACLPAGTVSGAPKIRAMQIINDLEEKKRGAYAGGIGYINFNHDLNIALTIRSLIIKDRKAYIQAGAGIVYDSIPENEYQETLNKARSLMEVLQFDLTNR